jgi:hypothetical protein
MLGWIYNFMIVSRFYQKALINEQNNYTNLQNLLRVYDLYTASSS